MTITPDQAAILLEKAEDAYTSLGLFVDSLRTIVKAAQTPSLFDHKPEPALEVLESMREKVRALGPTCCPTCARGAIFSCDCPEGARQ